MPYEIGRLHPGDGFAGGVRLIELDAHRRRLPIAAAQWVSTRRRVGPDRPAQRIVIGAGERVEGRQAAREIAGDGDPGPAVQRADQRPARLDLEPGPLRLHPYE